MTRTHKTQNDQSKMAIVQDLDGLLRQFSKTREQQPYYVAKDVAVETVFGSSPINFGSFLRYELEVDLEEFMYHERDSHNTKSAIGILLNVRLAHR